MTYRNLKSLSWKSFLKLLCYTGHFGVLQVASLCPTHTECTRLASTFYQFFVENVSRVCDNISDALASSARHVSAARLHRGPELSSCQRVTVDQVRRLLSSIPSKSSPLDLLPCTLLTSCADAFVQV